MTAPWRHRREQAISAVARAAYEAYHAALSPREVQAIADAVYAEIRRNLDQDHNVAARARAGAAR